MLLEQIPIYLGYDQRHFRIHPKGRGVVNDHRPSLQGHWDKFPRSGGPGAEKGKIHPGEGGGFQFPHFVFLSGKDGLRASGAFTRQRDHLAHGKFPAFQHAEDLLTHRPRHAHHRHLVHFSRHRIIMPVFSGNLSRKLGRPLLIKGVPLGPLRPTPAHSFFCLRQALAPLRAGILSEVACRWRNSRVSRSPKLQLKPKQTTRLTTGPWTPKFESVLSPEGSREGRANRPQLRCGIG